ncbi:MAG: excinuclease ABC subunit UvrA [Pirellulales bacterium]|nr:excinuclease ABC subunit UvrA [Pirellulales bacterium]
MPAADIIIKGAREHNLRSVDVTLPRNQLICLTGVSGSGKSSLAFDTLFAEGQRRYVESLSTFARQFLGQMPKPDVDHISGLSPSISISQKSSGNNPRSTVGTITEIYDFLRVLYARVGQGHCPQCGQAITAQSREQIIARIEALPAKTRFMILAPLARGQKGEFRDLFDDLLKQGFVRARVDGRVVQLTDDLSLDRQMRHDIEVVIDRLTAGPSIRTRLAEAVELGLKLGGGNLIVAPEDSTASRTTADEPLRDSRGSEGPDHDEGPSSPEAPPSKRGRKAGRGAGIPGHPGDITLSADYACNACGLSFAPPTPQLFSFNSPQGMCAACDGLGEMFSFDPAKLVPDPSKSFVDGAIELIGPLKDLGRWKRHIYEGVAETMDRKLELGDDFLLRTPWAELNDEQRRVWLWGTGDEHITFTWKNGRSVQKYGGRFDGVISELLERYRSAKAKSLIAKLEQYMNVIGCPGCRGERLNPQARAVKVTTASTARAVQSSPSLTLPEACRLPISDAAEFFSDLILDDTQRKIAAEALKEIRGRLGFLANVGLDYLSLDRTAPTLSGGESQRIRLAGQVGCGLVGVLYILDEPSIGLHPRDNDRLLATLERLRDLGNTVVVVEHDEDTMRAADHIIDFGPGPGVRGGHVVAAGDAKAIERAKQSVTGAYLSGKRQIAVPQRRRMLDVGSEIADVREKQADASETSAISQPTSNIPALRVIGARHNNLKNIDVEIPLGKFVCVTGVSGSGKSSLVNDIIAEALNIALMGGKGIPGEHDSLEGLEHLDKLIAIDQTPIGRTPRSNPATYIKVFDEIRDLYAQLPESKRRGYKPGRFSFNVVGGRCEACSGNGSNKLEMDFLADVWITCPVCQGHRFSHETLQVLFKGKSIAEVLEMDVQQALDHFENVPAIHDKLATLHAVGLDYMKLGQPSPTLSGGEAQRIKLARELVKKSTGRTLYLLDEPTTGLHFADIELLLKVLHDFVDAGNTVLVVEHNLDVIKTADWIIDIGPEGGKAGGQIVAAGTPEQIVEKIYDSGFRISDLKNGKQSAPTPTPKSAIINHKSEISAPSHTAVSLAPYLNGGSRDSAKRSSTKRPAARSATSAHITVRGARQHNLRNIDVDIPRDQLTVCCGPSGSGKTSLAMDTIYAEGQRRYVESLSSYARQFVGQLQKPIVEHIEGLSPAIAIEQRTAGHTPRSTVGTVTEIYDYFRILLSRLGQMHCPECDVPVGTQSPDEIIDAVLAEPEGTKAYLMAPLQLAQGEQYEDLWAKLRGEGYVRARIDGQTCALDAMPTVDRRRKHDVEIIVDRITIRKDGRARLADSVESALALGRGVLHLAIVDEGQPESRWPVKIHSQHLVCSQCGRSFEPLSPHHFSFNSSLGWCRACEGLGTEVGANPAALFRNMQMTLAEGAVLVWPGIEQPLFAAMLQALGDRFGLPTDVPFSQLAPRHRRLVLYGAGEEWIEVGARREARGASDESMQQTRASQLAPRASQLAPRASFQVAPRGRDSFATGESPAKTRTPVAKEPRPLFRFQYKGLYPALEEASRLSPRLRGRLEHLVDEIECSQCGGSRLRDDSAAVRFQGRTIDQYCRLPLGELLAVVDQWKLPAPLKKIAGELIREIRNRLTFLVEVGLEYLTLGRSAPTLSGGESQRIRLASQVRSGLCGVLYVLDEPTIGLHPRDNARLVAALHKLRDLGNTLLVVEHDRDVIAGADELLDFGPAAGRLGGEIVARGAPEAVARRRGSVTGPYLSGKKAIPVPTNRRVAGCGFASKAEGGKRKAGKKSAESALRSPLSAFQALRILGARHNNLKNISVAIPLGTLAAVTGVSGSGKSSLVEDVLYNQLARQLHRAKTVPGAHDSITGVELIDKIIRVDQRPLGNTPSSNPATYTGVFDLVRELFAQLPDSKVRGYTPRRFSFNVPGGRCEQCEGAGQLCIEMHFLPDVWVDCDSCDGHRYNRETLEVKYRGKSIAEVLEMSCGEARDLFENIPKIRKILQTLCDVGLDYVALGQSAATLSGGEAQRVKLAAELARPDTGRTLYVLDEPTTGLHFDDIAKLLDVLHRLVDLGNTVLVIEHNLDVIKQCDWIIDIGPEAGAGGGNVVAQGTPEQIVERISDLGFITSDMKGKKASRTRAASRKSEVTNHKPEIPVPSHTALALAPVLAAGPHLQRKPYDFTAAEAARQDDLDIADLGREVKMPWEVNGRRWHVETRTARNGQPCRWDGRILAEVERRIQQLGEFSPTDWSSRSVVEICAAKKSDGWFFHAITAEPWVVKLKFRTAKRTFNGEALADELALKPLNDLPEIEAYGAGPRVKCKNLRGPFQEVQIFAHSWEEIDTPPFWSFLEKAVQGFGRFTQRIGQNPEDVMPWKVLGRKWHLSRKGFPPGKKILWPQETLEDLLELLESTASGAAARAESGKRKADSLIAIPQSAAPNPHSSAAQFLWNNQQLIHLMVPGQRTPWATVQSKRIIGVDLTLNGPSGAFATGRIAEIGVKRLIAPGGDGQDQIKLRFVDPEDLHRGGLAQFLAEHLAAVGAASPQTAAG